MERITVAFPTVGKPVPRRDLADPALLDHLKIHLPHWFYHLEVIRPGQPRPARRFESIEAGDVRRLTQLLGLASPDFDVAPLELVSGLLQAGQCSEIAFPFPHFLRGNSFGLAVVAGLVSAATSRPIPPWVAFSGCLQDPWDGCLRLGSTGSLAKKVRLCLGRERDYDFRFLLDRLYLHPSTRRWLGERPNRVVSGEVKLLIVPVEVEDWSHDLRRQLGLEPIAHERLGDLGPPRFEDLRQRVRDLVGDGLLVALVPTAWHALRLLGFDHHHPRVGESLKACPCPGEGYLFGIDPQRSAGVGGAEASYREDRLQEQLRLLDLKLRHVPDTYGRLKAILRQCAAVLRCPAGNIARVGADKQWLEVVATWGGEGMRDLPLSVPAREGINGLVLKTGQEQIAESREQLRRLLGQLPATRVLETRYPPDVCRSYREMVARIPACADFPLKRGNEVIGVLCLHGRGEEAFDPDALHVVRGLAGRAELEVARLLTHEEAGRRRDAPGQARELAERVARLPLADAAQRLAQELAEKALKQSNGYRAAVRWLSHDRQSLAVIGLAGPPGAWPPTFARRVFSRTDPCACNRALDRNASLAIPDTLRTDLNHYEVIPSPSGTRVAAHLAIVLRSGMQPSGVLSVDFDPENRGACNPETEKALEDLAAPYANWIHSFSTDQLCAKLDAELPPLADDPPSRDVIRRWLDVVARAVGVNMGSLFLRNPATGSYDLFESLAYPDWSTRDTSYRPGLGRTGWVARQKRPLRIDDCEDADELARIEPPLEPSPFADCWDREREKLAYLGVPILVGDDVLGVLRLICRTPKQDPPEALAKTRFTSFDQQLVQAATARLAGWLYKRLEGRQAEAIGELTRAVQGTRSRQDLARRIHQALREGVGPCACVVRAVDRRDPGKGKTLDVLDRLFVGGSEHSFWPTFRARGEGVSGRVWAGKEKWVVADTLADDRFRQMARETGRSEIWWQRFRSLVTAPMLADGEVVGTLAIHRENPDILLQSDVAFIEQVAGLAGLALKRLVETEENRIQIDLLWAVVNYFQEGADEPARIRLLQATGKALTLGLGEGTTGHVWYPNLDGTHYVGVPDPDGEEVALEDIPQAVVLDELGRSGFQVVSDPEDRRLEFLLEALPPAQCRAFAGCQRAAILLARCEHLRLLQPALFFFAVRPPHRLSYHRIHRMVQMLATTLIRQRQRRPARPRR